MAKGKSENVELATNSSSMNVKVIIIIIVVVFVLIAGSIGITVFILSGDKASAENSESEDEIVENELINKPANYFLLKPDFVINFESDGKASFLSVQLEIMARTHQPIEVITSHMPVIRNNILLLLSAQKYEEVRKVAGKNKLRANILSIMNKIIAEENKTLENESSETVIDNIEAVYFTGFIMQ